MLNKKALEVTFATARCETGEPADEPAIRAAIFAYLTASMPEDVKACGLQCRYIGPDNGDFRYSRDWVEVDPNDLRRADYEYREVYDATALASLSAKVEELTRDSIVAPAECSANCDDPHCHYSHHPLTLRQAYENSLERLRRTEAALAERDRIIAEKDKALDAVRTPLTAMKFYTEACHDSPVSLQSHMNDGLPHVIEALAIIDAARAAREWRAS